MKLKQVEQEYGLHMPAGLRNLSWQNQQAVRWEHRRLLELVADDIKAGRDPREHTLAWWARRHQHI
ncbi:hypothetical protein D6827_02050 [Candidatus Parcubacteria bacterium]|nr:MAG: hypothetical protein D6827_02050 [Candidatus Parcubacteria bacterium]